MSEKYLHFTADDFAHDISFREWILQNNSEAGDFWTRWTNEHPQKRQEVLQAIALLEVLRVQEDTLSREQIHRAIEKTISSLDTAQTPIARVQPRFWVRWSRYAAALAFLLLTWWTSGNLTEKKEPVRVSQVAEPGNWLTIENYSTAYKVSLLPDGSKVVLDPAAVVRYLNSENKERVVRLSGSAFFDVVKDKTKPFKVLTGDLVTTVLGTSFKVTSEAASGKTMVRVMTGRVEVATVSHDKNAVLYPNQEVTYSESDEKLTKSVVKQHTEVVPQKSVEIVYESVPIGVIFEELEKVYHVRIEYDKKLLANCQITASFGAESFRDKLNLICRPVRGTVEEQNGVFLIKSPGCNF